MQHSMKSPVLTILSAVFLVGLSVASSRAETVTVLSSETTRVGQPVVLVYRFVNTAQPEDMPQPTINVDGLDIRYNGARSENSFSFNFGGGGNRSDSQAAFEFMYVVTPDRPGTFTIPGFDVQAGGQRIRTKPVTLKVVGSGGYAPPSQVPNPRQVVPPAPIFPPSRPSRPQQQQQPPAYIPAPGLPAPAQAVGGNGEPYFGEIVMGAKSAYVGEVVPVELRFYYRADLDFRDLQRPTFGGEGFTAAPLGEPEQTQQVMGDMSYNVVTFRTAVTPVKTGVIDIPPVTMEGQMMTPGAPPGLDPFFDQFFRNLPVPGFGQAEPVKAATNRRKIEVTPLPKEDRPANFSGAIGQFTLDASASPKSAQTGEPVTLSLTVEGRGNFDAISAPVLTGEDGWRIYKPKEKFEGSDAINYGGTKTFEFSMVARTDQTATPGAEFSYFDPIKKKYVTLTADPVAVKAAGGGAGSDEPSEAATASRGTTAPQQDEKLPPVPGAGANDIAAPAAALAKFSPGFTPWLYARWFHLLNLVLLAAAALSVPYFLWMRRRRKKSARTAALEVVLREARSEYREARDRVAFYAAAARFVQARLALWDDKPEGLVDPFESLVRRVPDPVERRELLAVLARRDEMKYGGAGSGDLDPAERRRVTELLDKFAAHHV